MRGGCGHAGMYDRNSSSKHPDLKSAGEAWGVAKRFFSYYGRVAQSLLNRLRIWEEISQAGKWAACIMSLRTTGFAEQQKAKKKS